MVIVILFNIFFKVDHEKFWFNKLKMNIIDLHYTFYLINQNSMELII